MNFLYRLYFKIPGFGRFGLIGKAFDRALDIFIFRPLLERIAPNQLKKEARSHQQNRIVIPKNPKLIVSLTSFPARINEVWISIECLLRQTVKPDELIIWLAESQFPDHHLPSSILNLQKRGLKINFCEDIRSHKKYYYSMLSFPQDLVITFDDDLYYDKYAIENLVNLHKKFPGCIVSNRAHKMRFDQNGKLLPYAKWHHNVTTNEPSLNLLATGGAGTLYPPSLLHADVFDKKTFLELSPNSDDVWLKIMSYRKKTKIVTNSRYNKDFITVGFTQRESLVSSNTGLGMKDVQLSNLISHYDVSFK